MALPERDSAAKTAPSSTSTSDHQTDAQSDRRQSISLTLSGEGGAEGLSEGRRSREGWFSPCDFCGKAELDHHCQESWRWRELIPTDTDELARYLMAVWDIHTAELVAIEVGPYAIRDALQIIWRGSKEGRRYVQPAGLIIKLARRIANATERAKRRQK